MQCCRNGQTVTHAGNNKILSSQSDKHHPAESSRLLKQMSTTTDSPDLNSEQKIPRSGNDKLDGEWSKFKSPKHWHTWFGISLLWVFSVTPLPLLAGPGKLMSELVYRLLPRRRHIVSTNIRACFPELREKELKKLTKKNFYETGKALLSSGIGWWGSRKRLEKLIKRVGWENLEGAIQTGRPIIILMSHCVGLEIGGSYLAGLHPLVNIYRKPRNKLLNAFMRNRRTRWGIGKLIEVSEGLGPAIDKLREGHWFYYLPDQDFGPDHSIFVPFFNIPTATLPVLAPICRATNAIVLPAFVNQLPVGKGFELIIDPPLENFPQGDAVKDTTTMNQATESFIRRYPDQYFWFHRRFKTRPEGEPDFY